MSLSLFFFSSSSILGGAERCLQTLILGLSQRGRRCVLITPEGSALQGWAKEVGVTHELLETATLRQRNPLRAFEAILRHRRFARDLIRKYGAGVFYANTRHAFIMLAMLPGRYVKLAHHRDVVSRPVNRLLYPRMDCNIFISNFNYTHSDAPANGQIIYDAAAYDCDLPAVLPDPPQAPLKLAMFARITPYKGHKLALEACARLNESGIPCHLDLWGEPGDTPRDRTLMDTLRAQVAEADLPVRFCGFHEAPKQIMRDYHCILNPSRDEPFGLIPVEAFSLGVPVISHRSGGSLEIYSGLPSYADYLFDDYSGAALHAALIALRDRAGEAAQMRAGLDEIRTDICQRFGIPRLLDEIEGVLGRVAN